MAKLTAGVASELRAEPGLLRLLWIRERTIKTARGRQRTRQPERVGQEWPGAHRDDPRTMRTPAPVRFASPRSAKQTNSSPSA